MNLETGRTRLRPLTQADFEAMHTLNSDTDSMRYVDDGKPKTDDQTRLWITKAIRHNAAFGYSECAVIDKATGAFVGWAGLFRSIDIHAPDEAEISYGLLPAFRGKGYATEIVEALVEYAFGTLKMRRLLATIDPANAPSIHIVRDKFGFVLTETKPDEFGLETLYFWLERPDAASSGKMVG